MDDDTPPNLCGRNHDDQFPSLLSDLDPAGEPGRIRKRNKLHAMKLILVITVTPRRTEQVQCHGWNADGLRAGGRRTDSEVREVTMAYAMVRLADILKSLNAYGAR